MTLVVVALVATLTSSKPRVLSNGRVRATIDASSGALHLLGDAGSGAAPFEFSNDSWSVTVAPRDGGNASTLSPRSCTPSAGPTSSSAFTVLFTCTPAGSATLFLVRAVYSLPAGAAFLQRQLAVCQYSTRGSGECDAGAKFFVQRAAIWDGMAIGRNGAEDSDGIEGPHHNANPYSQTDPRQGQVGSVIASFWRRPRSTDGLFLSVQNPFFGSGPPPPPPPPSPHADFRWRNLEWESFDRAAAWHVQDSQMGPLSLALNKASSAKALLPRALSGAGRATVTVSASFASTPQNPYGCAGLLLGSDAPSFGPGDNAFTGYEVSLSPRGGGFVVLTWHDHSSQQLAKQPVPVPLKTAVALQVKLELSADAVAFSISVGGKHAIGFTDRRRSCADASKCRGVGLRGYESGAVFTSFSAQNGAVFQPLQAQMQTQGEGQLVNQPALLFYSPQMLHDAATMGAWHELDGGVLGLTSLTAHALSESGTNMGEASAFQQCVEFFLLDSEMRQGKALRYNAAWDCNEYQLDVSKLADVAEYKRIIDRNAQIGIFNQVYEPRNTAVSSRFNHTDDWEWEQVLMFQLNIDFREGRWSPGDALPATVASMLEYFKSKKVRPTAYFYPVLNFQRAGDQEWLYPYQGVSGQRASLASVKLQDYLIESLDKFMNQTGAIGYAWDYTFFSDSNHSVYSQWRGWDRVTTSLRARHADMVCDNRQTAHQWGPWYLRAGSFSEPIAGDENPESYGAALASLSTDHVLANNLRMVNYKYRLQLLPNNRVPGFIFHQPERSFDNGTGTDKGKSQVWSRWHVRDFDHPGWKFSVLSTVGTAGCNLITANIPARDLEEHERFSAADVQWWRGVYAWADLNQRYLNKTAPIPGHGSPKVDAIDGTSAMFGDEGFLFLYNSGPLPRNISLSVDELIGLSNASSSWSWLLTELYPLDAAHHPAAIWSHGEKRALTLGGAQVRVLQLTRLHNGQTSGISRLPPPTASSGAASPEEEPSAWMISPIAYSRAAVAGGRLTVENASALAGATVSPLLAGRTKPTSVSINGVEVGLAAPGFAPCLHKELRGWFCATASPVTFDGTAISWSQQATDTAPPATLSEIFNWSSTFTIRSALVRQLNRSQSEYPIAWTRDDMDATWLAPNRLLMYVYVIHPLADMAPILASVDGNFLPMLPAYNSRGNRNSKGCFLGFYANMTGCGLQCAPDVKHTLTLQVDLRALPNQGKGTFLGVFWQNLVDEYSTKLKIKSDDAGAAVPLLRFLSSKPLQMKLPSNLTSFEGGTVIRTDTGLHLFTTDTTGGVVNTSLVYYHAPCVDLTCPFVFVRQLVCCSEGPLSGHRASLWAPMPVFDAAEEVYRLFYVQYSSSIPASNASGWFYNYDGQIASATSSVKGAKGIGGPYVAAAPAVVLSPGKDSQSWEGLQGTDSISPPFLLPDNMTWAAWYGSAQTQKIPRPHGIWWNGLVTTSKLGQPFVRRLPSALVDLNGGGSENPVVAYLAKEKLYLALFDDLFREGEGFGMSYSVDGLTWATPAVNVSVPGGARTPMASLLSLSDPSKLSVFYTNYGVAGGPEQIRHAEFQLSFKTTDGVLI